MHLRTQGLDGVPGGAWLPVLLVLGFLLAPLLFSPFGILVLFLVFLLIFRDRLL